MRPIFSYLRMQAIFTKASTGDGEIRIRSGTGCIMEIDHLVVGPDDYAAARDVTIEVRPSVAGTPIYGLGTVSLDNQRLNAYPRISDDAGSADNTARTAGKWSIGPADVVVIKAEGMADTETITVHLRGWSTVPPEVTASGGTVAVTDT